MAWKTGQSGNRKGRPRLDEVEKQNVSYFKQQLKKYSVTALEELFELMTKSINQVAKIMGMAEQTIYTKRNRLRKKLKNLSKIE